MNVNTVIVIILLLIISRLPFGKSEICSQPGGGGTLTLLTFDQILYCTMSTVTCKSLVIHKVDCNLFFRLKRKFPCDVI
jgi:hypothetical protein